MNDIFEKSVMSSGGWSTEMLPCSNLSKKATLTMFSLVLW